MSDRCQSNGNMTTCRTLFVTLTRRWKKWLPRACVFKHLNYYCWLTGLSAPNNAAGENRTRDPADRDFRALSTITLSSNTYITYIIHNIKYVNTCMPKAQICYTQIVRKDWGVGFDTLDSINGITMRGFWGFKPSFLFPSPKLTLAPKRSRDHLEVGALVKENSVVVISTENRLQTESP